MPFACDAPVPDLPDGLEYRCRGCGSRFQVPGTHKGQVLCTCGEQRPCLPAEPPQAEVSVSRTELLGYPVDLVTSPVMRPGYIVVGTMDPPGFGWLMAGRSAAELDAGVAALRESLAGLGAARSDQVSEILAAGRRLEEDVARLEAGITWYQRARSAARRLAAGVLRSIIRTGSRAAPESSDESTDDDHEDWTNPYSWRPGDPEL